MLIIKSQKVYFEDVMVEYNYQAEESYLEEPTKQFLHHLASQIEKQIKEDDEWDTITTMEFEMNEGLFIYWDLLNSYVLSTENDDVGYKPEIVNPDNQIVLGDYIK